MVQPIIGIRLKNKGFVSLLNAKGEYSKSIFVYRNDFTNLELPVYACKMASQTKIDKVFRIGKISLSEFYLNQIKNKENDTSKDNVVKIVSTLDEDGNLSIVVNVGNVVDFNPVKIYETNIYEEIEAKEIEDREKALLDYGDFVKCNLSGAFLLPEEDLSDGSVSILKEQNLENKLNENDGKEITDEKNILKKEDSEEDDDYYELADSAKKTKYTIGGKLVFIITLILLLSVGFALALISFYFSQDILKNAELNNFTTNEKISDSVSKKIESIVDNSLMFYDLFTRAENDSLMKEEIMSSFFERNKDVISVFIQNGKSFINNKFIVTHGIQENKINSIYYTHKKDVENSLKGIYNIKNVSHILKQKASAIFIPVELIRNNQKSFESLVIVFSTQVFEDLLANNSANISFITDKNGNLIAGLDLDKVMTCQNICDYEIVRESVNSTGYNSQIIFDYGNEKYYGAFKKNLILDSSVISIVPTSIVLEPVIKTIKKNAFLSLAIISLTIIVIWFFAKTISNPIKALSAAAIKIKNGEYKINLKPHTQDELGLLTTSFVDMGEGLAEREILKEAFGKFTNKEIADKAMKGELKLGGEEKVVTIFFSDIRKFTSLSESLSAPEVVEFLNEYMTKMVKCVTETGGFVDKYIGDAIMATWGTPISTGVPKEDAINALRCSLKMRAELIEFNKERKAKNKPLIKIGCGINTGLVVAGQIGSTERMEYTCIGDAVNTASRTESLNKPFCTDILITENTYELVKDEVIVEKMLPVKVFGKKELMNMYAVINLKDADDIPGAGILGFKTLDQVREILELEKPDLDGVDLNEEEKKFRIKK